MKREALRSYVFLTQTDTTIGFVSQNEAKLTQIKQRPPHKYYIKALTSLKTLQSFTRVPAAHKNRLRRANRTTFIMPDGHSYRLVRNSYHTLLLNRLQWAYTTSANLSGKPYDEAYAKASADVIVAPLGEAHKPSAILKLGRTTMKRIR